ncbi:AMP-binding protein [Spirillospora sp. NPDC047279]|uniref:AMP-binding protein n=1 Tax=Spirillospora sp. NPDC047279 TaxID=3155478 RepID=UPI0034000557
MSGTPIGTALTHLAAEDPDRPALTCGGETLTRRALEENANRFAWHLLDQDVTGHRVAVVLPNSTDLVVALLGIWKAGATPVPLAPKMPDAERQAVLDLAAPKLTVDALTLTSRTDPPPPLTSTPWKILASGGSTGRPKLIATTDAGLAETATLLGLVAQMRQNGTSLITAPLSHNGPFMLLTSALLLGNHTILMERFDAAHTLDLIQEHAIDWLYAVPTMMHRIHRLAPPPPATLQAVFHLGAPIAPWLKQAWIDWLGPEKIWELYAGTEAQASTLISGTEWLARRGSVGRPIKGEIEIRDTTGAPVPPNTPGQVWMRSTTGPSYSYIGADSDPAGWESLGDLGYMDPDGYLYLTDREADMILVGGANVYPAEIEAALDEHPAVTSSAVIGLPHEDLGDVPHALVQLSADTPDAALLTHLESRLSPHKIPRTFERVTTPLRDDAGKIRRSSLRAARLP